MKPTRKEIEETLLDVIANNDGKIAASNAYAEVAKKLNVSADVLSEKTSSGDLWWNNAVRWAREDLVRKGCLKRPEKSQRGLWIINDYKSRPLISIPEEITDLYSEGSATKILVNIYERNEAARNACIKHYKPICTVCSFDFESVYGHIGKGFIHVHHLIPISSIKKSYKLDPIADLRPICPNCHAMLHTTEPPISIEKLKANLTLASLL